MSSIRLTNLYVEKFPTPEGRVDIYDTDTRGLVLRVTSNGVKTWSFIYNAKGIRRRLTLGQYPGLTLQMARERAREARGAVQRGEDPVADKKEAEREAKENGFTSCKKEYIEKYQEPKNKTWAEVERLLDRFAIPEWGERPVKEIRRRDIVDLIEKVGKQTPFQANQLRSHLSGMFRWLVEREVIEVNPVDNTSPYSAPVVRERVLSEAELVALWKSTAKLGSPWGQAFRFLLLTGVRREEAARLRWNELDGQWALLPASRMKNGRDFKAPLSSTAKAIIDSMPKLGDFVFTTNGRSPIGNWNNAQERLNKLMAEELRVAEVPNWTRHDLRRTLATGVAMLGYRREVIDRILAHVPKKSDVTSSVYNRFMYDAEAMEAVTKWAAHIAKLVSGLEVVQRQTA